ncbi:MAG TPA: hypothetical protein VKU01_32555 [Bryobacteraceae bacterium]|nr:hypothetical protein [Bryobacteraceae bacterium]
MIEIRTLSDGLAPSVRAFNERVSTRGVTPFPEEPVSQWLPKRLGCAIYEEPFVAIEDGQVRGGYILIQQEASIGGQITSIGGLRLPISEALVNPKYGLLPARLVLDAQRRQPLLFGMGMGGEQTPVARLLGGLKFQLRRVPFYFKINHAARFLTGSTILKPWLARLLLYSGVGWAGTHALSFSLAKPHGAVRKVIAREIGAFDDWADRLWEANHAQYSFVAVRNSSTLNALYPPADKRFIRLQVKHGRRIAGWALLLDLHLTDHPRFGNLRAGQIVDCFAAPDDAQHVIRAASQYLENRGVDFVRSHQSHPSWRRALQLSGFFPGRSYFLFGASPALGSLLARVDPNNSGVHLNRGDGDGPLYLPRKGIPAERYPATV